MRGMLLVAMSAGMVWAQGDGKLDKAPEFQEFQAERAAQAQIEALKAQVATLQARLSDLKLRYSDAHPDVQAAQRSLLQADAQLSLVQLKLRESLKTGKLAPANDDMKIPLQDRWWRNVATAEYLGLTADQQKKMDDVVARYRAELLWGTTGLKAAERALDLMVSAEPLDEAKTMAQIDAVAFIRAELEKSNGHMLLGIRKLLMPEQWTKLNQAFTLNLTKESTR